MWENFKLGKILENRNKIVKWNTVTYPLDLSCQGKKGCFFSRDKCLVDMPTPYAVNVSSSSPPHTHSQYLYKFLCIYMYVHPKRQLDKHPHEHTVAGNTTKIGSELIFFILSSRCHFWIGVLMLLRTWWDEIGQFWLQIGLPIYYAGASST